MAIILPSGRAAYWPTPLIGGHHPAFLFAQVKLSMAKKGTKVKAPKKAASGQTRPETLSSIIPDLKEAERKTWDKASAEGFTPTEVARSRAIFYAFDLAMRAHAAASHVVNCNFGPEQRQKVKNTFEYEYHRATAAVERLLDGLDMERYQRGDEHRHVMDVFGQTRHALYDSLDRNWVNNDSFNRLRSELLAVWHSIAYRAGISTDPQLNPRHVMYRFALDLEKGSLTQVDGTERTHIVHLSELGHSKCVVFLEDLDDDLGRQGIKVNKRRHGKEPARELRRLLKNAGYGEVAKAIELKSKGRNGKPSVYYLDIPHKEIRLKK